MVGIEALATIPEWVVPPHAQVIEALRTLAAGVGDHDEGQESALRWATDVTWSTPVSCRGGERPVSLSEARAECWMAVCAAADAAPPTGLEWQLLGAAPRETVASDPDYAHGVWQVLGWLLGEVPDPPRASPGLDPASHAEFERRELQRREAAQRCVLVRRSWHGDLT